MSELVLPMMGLKIFLFIIGLCLGSFFNVLADRLPHNAWPTGRSKCDFCGKILRWSMLIPVFSYAIGKAQSVCCGKRLSVWYPISELLTGILFVGMWNLALVNGWNGIQIALYFIIMSSWIVTFLADVKYHIIPDLMTIVFTIAALMLILPLGAREITIHMAGGLLLFALLYILYGSTKGRGMGFGDVKFAFPMGLLLGPVYGFLALYISFMIGGIYGTGALLSGNKKLKSSIAFGPFLIAGTAIMVVWGQRVWIFFEKLLG